MISKERLIKIIDNLVAWGQEHNEEFYDCLMGAADMTDEELAELGFVYDYKGEEDPKLVKLQKELEDNQTVITSPEQILKVCKENNIDTYHAFIACGCDAAFGNVEEKKGCRNPLSYDKFCSACENLWLDWEEENPGLSSIADLVVEYYNENHELPEEVCDII